MNKQVADLSQYCYQLLLMHDCVIVPGFGGFIAHYRPAYYSDEHEKFFPPSREISFNRSISSDDGLLANHISVIENIPFAEARFQLKKMAQLFEAELFSSKLMDVKGIGLFKLLKGSEFQFIPCPEGLSPMFTYGLGPVVLTPLKSAETIRKVKEMVSGSTGFVQALAGVALLIGLTFVPVSITKQSLVNQQKATFEIPFQQKTYSANNNDSISSIIDEMTDKKNALQFVEQTEEKPAPAVDTVQVKKVVEKVAVVQPEKKALEKVNVSGFYLIAGSFVEMWRVEKFVEEMKQKGFVTTLIESDGKLRVSVAFSSVREEAEKSLVSFRNAHPDMAFWLLSKK